MQVDDGAKEFKAIWGVVGRQMDQNANVAEHIGLINAIFEAEPECEFVTDCETISNACRKGLTYAAGAKRPHGGIWREASGLLCGGRGPSNIRKCKAHKDISSLEGDERTEAVGNDAADKNAKSACS